MFIIERDDLTEVQILELVFVCQLSYDKDGLLEKNLASLNT